MLTNVYEDDEAKFSVLNADIQVSQYTFAMCSYRERKQDPTEILQLDGHTVDFCDPLEGRQSASDLD